MNIIYLIFIILAFFFWLVFIELLKPRYLVLLITFIAIISLTKIFFFQPYKIPAKSMVPTLRTGDHIIVNKFFYNMHDPLPGDVIIFELTRNPKQAFIKRIIGQPGDKIEIRSKALYINDKRIYEQYAINIDPQIIPPKTQPRDFFGPINVPKNHLFMLGDNRDFSSDSRFWGFLPMEGVKGKVSYIYWSLDSENKKVRWKRIGKSVY
ncbi:MAG: signal peptidase I [Deltaproteobacteria bacterium]|nr:signal peptidase I [Deltaproteobacteria bacterium]